MPRQSLEFPRSVEGTVEFDELTCCALGCGFEQNATAVGQLEEIVGKDKIKLFKDILFNTLNPSRRPSMKFVPSEEMKTIYGQIAKTELERLDAERENEENLSCGHSVISHQQVLNSVAERMKTVLN